MIKPLAVIAAVALITTGGCGGGALPPVTFVYQVNRYEAATSYRTISGKLERLAIVPLQVQCGFLSEREGRGPPLFLNIGGSAPLLYYQLTAGDAELARELDWLGVVDEEWRNTYTPANDCDPTVWEDG